MHTAYASLPIYLGNLSGPIKAHVGCFGISTSQLLFLYMHNRKAAALSKPTDVQHRAAWDGAAARSNPSSHVSTNERRKCECVLQRRRSTQTTVVELLKIISRSREFGVCLSCPKHRTSGPSGCESGLRSGVLRVSIYGQDSVYTR